MYCGNNSINRIDTLGEAWESAFDIISLGASIIDVWKKTLDLWSWAGLIGDTVNLIPFITGVGEAARAIKIGNKITDTADTLGNVARKTTTTINKIYNIISEVGYASFNKLKRTIGAPGEGKECHHIVEQSQILKSGFSPEIIHNTGNIVAIDRTTHRTIRGTIQVFNHLRMG